MFDEFGQPFIIIKDQEKKKRLTGIDALKVFVILISLLILECWMNACPQSLKVTSRRRAAKILLGGGGAGGGGKFFGGGGGVGAVWGGGGVTSPPPPRCLYLSKVPTQ